MELPSKKGVEIEKDDKSLASKDDKKISAKGKMKIVGVKDKKLVDNAESKLDLQDEKKTLLQEGKKTALTKNGKPFRKTSKAKSKYWVIIIFVLTFIISALFTIVSELALSNNNVYIAFLILITLLAVNIIFDIIGVAAQSADIEPFISKAARKQPSAMLAVKLLKNAEKVSNFCNDVVGDVCGIVSGVAGATLIIIFASGNSSKNFILSVIVSSVISALTVGGKAIGKKVAMDNDHEIIVTISNMLSVFKKNKEKKPSGNRKSK